MTTPEGAEARAQPRVRVSWRSQVTVGSRTVEGRTTDISEGGIGLKLQEQIQAGQVARIVLLIPDAKGGPGQMIGGNIRIAFSVLSQDGVRMGGPWIDLPANARSALTGFIRQQLLRSF